MIARMSCRSLPSCGARSRHPGNRPRQPGCPGTDCSSPAHDGSPGSVRRPPGPASSLAPVLPTCQSLTQPPVRPRTTASAKANGRGGASSTAAWPRNALAGDGIPEIPSSPSSPTLPSQRGVQVSKERPNAARMSSARQSKAGGETTASAQAGGGCTVLPGTRPPESAVPAISAPNGPVLRQSLPNVFGTFCRDVRVMARSRA